MNTYAAAVPLSMREYYRPTETVDFKLVSGVGKALQAGSIRIAGKILFVQDLTATPLAAIPANYASFKLDGMIGVNGVFTQYVSQTQNQGVLENLQNYGRVMADMSSALKTSDMTLNQDQKSLCAGYDAYSVNIVGTGAAQSFVLDPNICINRSNGVNISYAKTGDITINLVVASPKQVMYGPGYATAAGGVGPFANGGFVLTNLECHYRVVDDVAGAEKQPVELMTLASVKQVANSTLAAFSIISPIPSYSFTINYIAVANELAGTANSMLLETIPSVSKVEFTFQDTNGSVIQYPLDNAAEIYKFWLDSYGSKRSNPITAGQCMGVKYNQLLANTKFGVLVQSALAAPYSCYIVFHGITTI